jgi:hypothetical protein
MAITISGSTGIAGVDGSASTPALQGTDTNTGVYFGADSILFSEGGTKVGEFDSSGNLQFNSGYGSVAVAYGCRAWVNFNGTGTVAIRASGNVTSITDNGTGDYTVNFTNAMPDANYATAGAAGLSSQSGYFRISETVAPTTSAVRVNTANNSGSALVDLASVNVAVFR